MTKRERYIRNQEKIKEKAIYKILQSQKKKLVSLLKKESKSFRILTTKGIEDDIVGPWIEDIMGDIPSYFLSVLPAIMKEGAKPEISRYKDLLPSGYELTFDVETESAGKYLAEMEDLMLSQRKGSITKTMNDEVIQIIKEGVEAGKSYSQVAKEIEDESPWVFSKSRARTIAVNEIGRAYGWSSHEPGRVLQDEGYVMEKSWQTSGGGIANGVRPTHTDNEDAGWIPFDDLFPGTEDEFAPSTNDINCRCTSIHRIVGIKSAGGIHRIERGTLAEDIKKLFETYKKSI